jgi:hypothetical protein
MATIHTFSAGFSTFFALGVIAGLVGPLSFETHMCNEYLKIGIYRLTTIG